MSYLTEAQRMLMKANYDYNKLTAVSSLRDIGFSAFLHGSVVTTSDMQGNPRMNGKSDIDLSLIGPFDKNVSPLLEQEFKVVIPPEMLSRLDYISFSRTDGRKTSFHIENQDYIANYPHKSVAREWRPNGYQKSSNGKLSYYLREAIGPDGRPYFIGVHCQQWEFDTGVINLTPQTGIFYSCKDALYPKQREDRYAVSFPIAKEEDSDRKQVYSVDLNGQIVPAKLPSGEIMVMGLQQNKLTSNSPLDSNDYGALEDYVYKPIARGLQLLSMFINKADPVADYMRLVKGLAEIRRVKNGGYSRMSEEFASVLQLELGLLYDQYA